VLTEGSRRSFERALNVIGPATANARRPGRHISTFISNRAPHFVNPDLAVFGTKNEHISDVKTLFLDFFADNLKLI